MRIVAHCCLAVEPTDRLNAARRIGPAAMHYSPSPRRAPDFEPITERISEIRLHNRGCVHAGTSPCGKYRLTSW